MIKIKNKKGVERKYIVTFIILLVGFIIILIFLPQSGLGRESDKQICYNSVVLKSKSIGIAGSLNCKTNYLCISGGSKCKEINPTSTVKVDSNDKEKIMKAIADEMVNCWWMFGEGELDYRNLFERSSCALCSIIRFDDKILGKNYRISYREFLEYLSETDKDYSQTYFNYLYDSSNIEEFIDKGGYFNMNLDNNYILDDDEYAIVTGIVRNEILYSTYLKTSQINSIECRDFVTKA